MVFLADRDVNICRTGASPEVGQILRCAQDDMHSRQILSAAKDDRKDASQARSREVFSPNVC